jgi:branched-chain amino acid transport system ATP-binding protein
MTVLTLDRVSLAFGGIQALSDVSLTVPRGQVTAVVGPNGAGKTSLFNVVCGFYRQTAGRIMFDGQEIGAMAAYRRASLGIARSFQHMALIRGLSVLDNIKLGLHPRLKSNVLSAGLFLPGVRREEHALTARIDREIIAFLGLESVRDHAVETLPYGMQKRVELARVLAAEPSLLMLDEPAAGLNRGEKEEFGDLVLECIRRWPLSVILIDHDMGMVMRISDQVVVLNFGRVIAAGQAASVQANPDVIQAYLGVA